MMSEAYLIARMNEQKSAQIPAWFVRGEYRSLGEKGFLGAIDLMPEEIPESVRVLLWPRRRVRT